MERIMNNVSASLNLLRAVYAGTSVRDAFRRTHNHEIEAFLVRLGYIAPHYNRTNDLNTWRTDAGREFYAKMQEERKDQKMIAFALRSAIEFGLISSDENEKDAFVAGMMVALRYR